MSGVIVGILLAAGNGRRFGSHKLLEPLRSGIPLAVAAARNLQAGTDWTLAVVRPGDKRLANLLRAEGLEIVYCADADGGMGASLARGVIAAADADGWLIALADMPFIQPQTIRAVARMIRRGSAIAAPMCRGRRGHPVGFSRGFGRALAALWGEAGARQLLRRRAAQLDLLPTNDAGIHLDIDTPQDLASCRRPAGH